MDTVKMNPPMPDANRCPQCGTPLPTGALTGLCPACLLKVGAAADTVTNAKQPAFNPPTIEELAPLFPQLEILGLIGKGGMGAATQAACSRHGCVYLQAVGGAAALLAQRIQRVEGVYLLDQFGATEALWQLEVEGFETVVGIDAHGRDLFGEVRCASGTVLQRLVRGHA